MINKQIHLIGLVFGEVNVEKIGMFLEKVVGFGWGIMGEADKVKCFVHLSRS